MRRARSRRVQLNIVAVAAACCCCCCRCCCCCCCCCWQHVRLPPRGVRRFPGWHVLKLEFWHFPLPKFILRFLFLSVFAVFLEKKTRTRRPALVQKPARRSVSHRFFRCFPVCVAFRIGICSVLAISRLSAHASFDLHLFFF